MLRNLLQVGLQGGDSLIEHTAMGVRTRQITIGPCLGQSQLDCPATILEFTLVGSQSPSKCFLALGFRLLEFDVFTLEAASHSPVF